MMSKMAKRTWRPLLCLFLLMVLLVFSTDSPAAADVYGAPNPTPAPPDSTNSMDQPYTGSPIVVCVENLTTYGVDKIDKNALRQTFVNWLNSTSNPTGYGGIPSVSFADGGPQCDGGNLHFDFRWGTDPVLDGADGMWPVHPWGGTLQWGFATRFDNLRHLVNAGIALNADTWVTKNDTQRQYEVFHEVGHALGVTHEGPVMSPVAFGKAPFTRYGTCENWNCLASTYDTADYDNWSYNYATNTGTPLGIANSDTAWTDREMIGAYYGSPGVGMRAAQPIYSCLGNPAPGVLRATAIDANRYEDGYLAELYKWTGSQWVYYGPPKWLWPSTSPAFGARMTAADFDIGEDTGQFSVGFRGHREDSGYNYTEPVDWSYIIEVTGYTNNDVHPPCTISPARAASNVSYLNWVRTSQNESYVVVKFRHLSGYKYVLGGPYPPFTFVTNVNYPITQAWHWFTPLYTIPPNYMRFAYQLTAVGPGGQSYDSEWVLVEPNDTSNP